MVRIVSSRLEHFQFTRSTPSKVFIEMSIVSLVIYCSSVMLDTWFNCRALVFRVESLEEMVKFGTKIAR